jgi:hypothetical protein
MKKLISIGILAGLVIGMVLTSGCTVLNPYQVRVIYPGQWFGLYAFDNSPAYYIGGPGTKTYDVQTPKMLVVISASKNDASSQSLTVEILKNGNVIKSNSTDAPKGAATCVYMI